jgi:hypothetical protein
MPIVHEITTDEQGNRHGTDGAMTISLLGQDGTMFKRRAIKRVGTPEAEEVCWLVTELNGVKVYQNGNSIVVTEQDMYP